MQDDEAAARRRTMVRHIEAEAAETAFFTGRGAFAAPVLDAMGRVPRHLYVPPRLAHLAYEDTPLPIGSGQTISQPFIVALMTDLLDLRPDSRVLEVGTGSGYQAAVLADLVAEVYSIEAVASLAETAEARMRALALANVHVRHGDGNKGWPDAAPFDRIIVTAAASELPPELSQQLAPGGLMVVPLGRSAFVQHLMLYRKGETGELAERPVLPVAFVPLVRPSAENGAE